ncbi:hypothetical protein EDD21DRAFT_435592 [Dissophora ornata]|nr:hypothetical protein BGZ58_008864 [Dissophora ornata]KAI8598218.1 hypothetical protein EDD21DRAFT_435592 [Dissophora ornata]
MSPTDNANNANNENNEDNANNATPNSINDEDTPQSENQRLQEARIHLKLQLMFVTGGEYRRGLKASLALVNTMLRHPHLFNSNSGGSRDGMAGVTAEELYDKLWYPVLLPLFEDSPIPIRFHIQRPVQRQEEQEHPMTDEDRAFASRVQVNLLLDHDHGAYNLAIIEIAKDLEHARICESRIENYAEGKAMTERLATILPEDQAVTFVVQIAGHSGKVISFRKAAQYITIATPAELNLQLPTNLVSFPVFGETLRNLLRFKERVNVTGNLILERLSSH